ncbi:zonadhesin [Elysia marginata]|uniref:Zonadhesin n=1 Tax=Elysia marginata TaxID=1093978 RepID=A0AAV4F5H4_9GAST|nr:zonadhesin [Elysia marginata]
MMFQMNKNGTRLTMSIKRQEYHHNCIFDMCESKNPDEVICDILKTFAQECAYLGVTVKWRSPERCPMKCPKNEIYRTDASCQRQCNEEPGTQGACNEDPVEGCACKDGFRRRNNKCVRKEECGCRVLDFEGNLIKYLQPGEDVILPKCTELAKCVRNEDKTLSLRFIDYSLPNNAICANTVPPTYVCAKGFKFAEDGKTCVRARDSCSSPYEMIDGMCIHTPRIKRNWRQALYRCNQADGTLVHIDTFQKINTIKRLLVNNKWESVYISGRVVAKNMFGLVMFTPLLEKKERGQISWMNYHFYDSFVDKLFLSKYVDKKTIPEDGLVLSVVASLDEGEVVFRAVSSNYRSNMVCEERPPPDNPVWTPPCNTDSHMEDDGDQETLFNMQMDDNCLVCPKPMDVKCETVKGSSGVEGKCQVSPDGVFYSCNQGKACADKTVSTKCHQDVDECAEKRDDCPQNSKCINTIGAFRCKCPEASPLIVRGECKEVTSCVVKGPENVEEYIYDLKPFSGRPSTFDVDCSYKIVSFCGKTKPAGLPFVSVYDVSRHSEKTINEEVYVVIDNPDVKGVKVAILSRKELEKGTVRYDQRQGDQMAVRDLSFIDETMGVKFELAQGPKLVIRSTENFFKVSITFPLKVQVDLSSDYSDKVCGICTAVPPEGEQSVVLTDAKLQELTINPEYAKMNYNPQKCKPRTPPRDIIADIKTTPPPATQAPSTTSPPTQGPTQPPPPPPLPKSECEQTYKDFCKQLSSVCAVSRRACEMELCPGQTRRCDYLQKNAFVSCNTGSKLKSFIKKQNCDSGKIFW